MISIQIIKRLGLSMALIFITLINVYANEPQIADPEKNINLNQSATLLLTGNYLASPLTITIGEDVQTIKNNSNPNKVTCPILSRSIPGSVTFTVQNEDGIFKNGRLNFIDCSSFIQLDDIVRNTDFTIPINNLCYTGYQYQLDTATVLNLESSEIHLSGLSQGAHQLKIIGFDAAGNTCSESVSFTVDSLAPEIKLDNIPTRITTNYSETISVTTSEDATHYKYMLDNGYLLESSISEPIFLSPLSLGTHTLLVYGCDNNNNCQTSNDVNPITWTVTNIAFAQNSALTKTRVLAGTQSGVYSTTCTEDDVVMEWTVYNDGNPIGNPVIGNTFSYTPKKEGAYAGVYTVNMSAKVDGHLIQELSADIEVPFDIVCDRYNIIEETIFTIEGVESGSKLIPDIKPNIDSPDSVDSISDIGKWSRDKPGAMDITFTPSKTIDVVTSFDVWISVENDKDLNKANGLFQQTAGPFFIIPLKTFTISLADENGSISTSTNTDITIKDMVTQTNQNLAASKSDVRFTLPASGGTYYFKVKDNRSEPTFMPQFFSTTNFESTVFLQHVGEYVIDGSVQDADNKYLENATVTAFQPIDETSPYIYDTLPQQYEAKTESSGKYTIFLPESNDIGGWTVIAGNEGYVSVIKNDQQANTEVSFDGINALQQATQISKVWTENDKILIQANPSFQDEGDVDIRLITKDSDSYFDENQLDNTKIIIAKPTFDEYTLLIYADTCGDIHDPKTGNFVVHAYRKDSSDKVLAREDKTMDTFGGSVLLNNNNHEVKVEVPVNGITETATITIEQIEKANECNATTGTQYVYGVHATSVESAHSLSDDQINQIAITIPFDLRKIKPGEIESSVFNIYRADTLAQLENHETELINNIRQSDYLGNGKMGSVTVLVDKLSYFAIGVAPETKSVVDYSLKDEGGGDCFIGILH
jgi:hypothetical protein